MPSLRRSVVVAERSDGLPLEVLFELSTSLTYSLVYAYDLENYEVTWEPRVGARDAVRGSARLDAIEGGTRLTYKLEQGGARKTGDLVLGGPHAFIDAFVRWLAQGR
ncbi:MAG: hypothetical protein M4D80_26985 [Myxococcota bacterium]|nr:hypothetical protein [Myxococcota bacterium]